MNTLKILTISGSIRMKSSSHAVIHEFARLLPTEIEMELFSDLASIPAFDGRDDEPESVIEFKNKIKSADGILICTPEYAFGVPGALKNALDWTVGSGDFMNKPVALITASSQGEKGHESLQNTLTALSAKYDVTTTLLIPFIRTKVHEGKVTDEKTREAINRILNSLLKIISRES